MGFNEGDIEVGILLNLRINNKNRMDFFIQFWMKSIENEEEFNFGRERKWNNKEQFFLDGKRN
jgi:hypothetical protein